MVDHIKYEPGAILISASMLGGFLPDGIDLGAVQHRLSYDELRNCWMRMQSFLAVNFKIRNMLTGVFAVFVIILFIMLLTDTVKTNPILGLFISFTIIMISLAMCINATQTKKKLQGLIERENHEIWNSKGLYWKYAEYRAGHHQHGKGKNSTTVYLELRLSASAMDYNAPGQPFQGTLPNPYMQPQINYTPQVELPNYGQQNQPVYGQQPQYQPITEQQQQQPQFQPTYGQQPQPFQGYPATNTYVGHPTYS